MQRVGSILDHTENHLPSPRPADANALANAAAEYRRALCPGRKEQIVELLVQMRSMTHLRQTTAEEATASFDLLVDHFTQFPVDIVRKAIRAYVTNYEDQNAKFFPKSPSELLKYATPMLRLRSARASNLERLAKQAADLAAEEAKRNTPPIEIDDDELRRFGRSHAETELRMGWINQAQFDRCFPTSPPNHSPTPDAIGYEGETRAP